MTRAVRRRPLRAFGAALAALALVALAVAFGVTDSPTRAAANPSGASPEVYVATSLGRNGRAEQFSLAALRSGNASSTRITQLADMDSGPVAVNSTATDALVGVAAPAGTRIPQRVAAVDVGSGAVTYVAVGTEAPVGIAADPANPAIFYVLGTNGSASDIYKVSLNTSPPSAQLMTNGNFGSCCGGTSLAISPDGDSLFAGLDGDGIGVIASVPVANPLDATYWSTTDLHSPPTFTDGIADLVVAPNGKRLYAAGPGFNDSATEGIVFALSLPLSSTSGGVWSRGLTYGTASPIQIENPKSLTVGPYGATLYVAGNDGTGLGSAVQTLATSNGDPGRNAQVPLTTDPNAGDGVVTIALSPDDQTVLVAGTDYTGNASLVYPLSASSLALGTRSALGIRTTLSGPQSIAITPDQAPTANFSVALAQAGHATTFDANSSSVTYGSVTRFAWNFGDGQSATTGSPVISHTFANAGAYNVTLTETDSAGTSIPPAVGGTSLAVDGPGQTPYRRASPSARKSQTVDVPSTPPPPTTAPHKAGAPTLTLNPAVGAPGTIVTVTGSGFKPSTPITIAWSLSTGSVVVTPDIHGNIPPGTEMFILVPDVLGPRDAVASSTPKVQAPFLVVPGTTEPGGDDASLLFRSEGP